MNEPIVIKSFAFTDEYYRFSEFCDACRNNRYIGLCYGAPGVGKTLSARRYTHWDDVERFNPATDLSFEMQLQRLNNDPLAVLFTPEVTTTPRQVLDGIHAARNRLYNILEERVRRNHESRIDNLRQQLSRLAPQGDEWNREAYDTIAEEYHAALSHYRKQRETIPKPNTSLIVIDEADRLRMTSLEQARDIFDRSEVGMVLIGMPGIEKRLARYPQLYSRVGFVHEFRPLTKGQILKVLQTSWRPEGVHLPIETFDDESLTAIVRITGGNFRLLHRLLSQIGRILEINHLPNVTLPVVDAARESLVIGMA